LLGIQKTNVLSCGLFGASGLNIDVDKIKHIGAINDSRGGDGNGYFYGNLLKKGVDKLKKFVDHVLEEPIDVPNVLPTIFIGHTRKATSGTHIDENTHPFLIDNTFVLAHNGVIYNIDEMCRKYDFDNSKIHVDSKALAHLIHKEGVKVLEEYKGYAALSWVDLKDPDSLYLYHGASKEYTTANAQVLEERPLYCVTLDGTLYYSSIESSLTFIRDRKQQKVFELPHNKVFKITKGRFNGKPISINREERNINIYDYKYPKYNNSHSSTAQNYQRGHNHINKNSIPVGSKVPTSIYVDEQSAANFMPNKHLFFWQSRFWYRAAPNSIQYPIKANGIFYAHRDTGYAERAPISTFVSGSKDVYKVEDLPETKMLRFAGEDILGELYYFYEGVMIRSKKSYEMIMNELTNYTVSQFYKAMTDTNMNKAVALSHHSKYPVMLVPGESSGIQANRNMFWLEGRPATATNLAPRFSNKVYNFFQGNYTGSAPDPKKEKSQQNTQQKMLAPTVPITDYRKVSAQKGLDELAYFASQNRIFKTYGTPLLRTYISIHEYDNATNQIADKAVMDYLIDYIDKNTAKHIPLSELEIKDAALSKFEEILTEEVVGKNVSIMTVIKENYYQSMFIGLERFVILCGEEFEKNSIKENDLPFDAEFDALKNLHDDDSIHGNFQSEDDEDDAEEAADDIALELLDTYFETEGLPSRIADELQVLDESDFAQEVALMMYNANDSIMGNLKEIAYKYKKEELLEQIKFIQSNHK
jgi:hypothetical protein